MLEGQREKSLRLETNTRYRDMTWLEKKRNTPAPLSLVENIYARNPLRSFLALSPV